MSKKFYNKFGDDDSYLYDKHKKYKLLQEEEKLEYSNGSSSIISTVNIQVDTDSDNDN